MTDTRGGAGADALRAYGKRRCVTCGLGIRWSESFRRWYHVGRSKPHVPEPVE